MPGLHDYHGPNAGYVLELFERYREDPSNVDETSRKTFDTWELSGNGELSPSVVRKVVAAVQLAIDIREYGHHAARLDPLGSTPRGDPALELTTHDLTEEDLRSLPPIVAGGPRAEGFTNALEAIRFLRVTYSSAIGYDYDQVQVPEERIWLRDAAEEGWFRPAHDGLDERGLLARLSDVQTLETFLHRIFVGKTRFSIEGLDMLVPVLDEIISEAAEADVTRTFIGMGHRGRLNVLAHILGKPYAGIFAEFKDIPGRYYFREDVSWTGDVKYHKGAHRNRTDGEEVGISVTLAPNPSHVELIDPVILGMARAAGTDTSKPGAPRIDGATIVPILIHGDAAFSGQGVVTEALNLSRLPGYGTAGTIHIIANNQIGFTTEKGDLRSTTYASDPAKGYEIPIVHVNADDPEACIEAARLAVAYRQRFGKDFVIDLIGYRRYGHNEGDEPSFTQPLMSRKIKDHPAVRKLWADKLLERGAVDQAFVSGLVDKRMKKFEKILDGLEPAKVEAAARPSVPPKGAARSAETAVPQERLMETLASMTSVPDGFSLSPKLKKAIGRRRGLLRKDSEEKVDWATAEDLALASILADGVGVRLTGEDSERGTFNQRHAVFHDASTGQEFIPLQSLPQAQAAFEVHNSPLSENAALGFEIGYNIQEPTRLVLWEAQYGDFVNNAQTVIDELIVSGRAKWGLAPSVVLLLPHGYEGQGPDHSTGRLERFLQLAAEMNVRIVNCTTAAQYFHVLRRQAVLLQKDPLPLVVMTPKSLLRHPAVASPLSDFSDGRWQPLIDDLERSVNDVRRIVMCSGKVAVDLLTSDEREDASHVAVTRLEQLYPFPEEEAAALIGKYKNANELFWVQEEPQNMGAWESVRPELRSLANGGMTVKYLGRPRASSPAEGSSTWHAMNQRALVRIALDVGNGIGDDIWITIH